jgi:hypothetical protein
VLIVGFLLYDIFRGNASWASVGIGLLAGTAVGIVLSRMRKVSWDEDTGMTVSAMDSIGVIFLVLYILFEVFRGSIVGLFLQGPLVASASLAMLAGSFYGRVLGNLGSVARILREQGVFRSPRP